MMTTGKTAQDIPIACERCRSRRKKCGRELDGCAQCKEKGKVCVYHSDKRKGKRKDVSNHDGSDKRGRGSIDEVANVSTPLSFQLNPYGQSPVTNGTTTRPASTVGSSHNIERASTQTSAQTSREAPGNTTMDNNFDSSSILDSSIWNPSESFNNSMLFSWLDFDLLEAGGGTSFPTPASSRHQFDVDIWGSATLSNEHVVFAALPSRSKCEFLLQTLEARTRASPFTAPENFVDMGLMKQTIAILQDRRESSASSPPIANDKSFFSSHTFHAMAGLACAFIRRSYTPFNKVAQDPLGETPKSSDQSVTQNEAAQERQEITQLLRACQVCMNAIKGASYSVDLARLQAYRMFAMVLAWWGDLKEASHVSWLGIRYATSVGLHRREGLQGAVLASNIVDTVYLDVFWQIFNQASMFQILMNRELPVDVESITVPLPAFPRGSGTQERLEVQFVGAQVADKYFRDASGLRLPSEKNLTLLEPLQSLSFEDDSNYSRLNADLDRSEQGLANLLKNDAHIPIHTLQGSVQPMLIFYRYIRILCNYPFSLRIPEAKTRVEENTRSIFLTSWNLSKNSDTSINRPTILAAVCLRTMIFAAKFHLRSSYYEEEQWDSYLALGYDALERLCSHTESSKTLSLAKEILAEAKRARSLVI